MITFDHALGAAGGNGASVSEACAASVSFGSGEIVILFGGARHVGAASASIGVADDASNTYRRLVSGINLAPVDSSPGTGVDLVIAASLITHPLTTANDLTTTIGDGRAGSTFPMIAGASFTGAGPPVPYATALAQGIIGPATVASNGPVDAHDLALLMVSAEAQTTPPVAPPGWNLIAALGGPETLCCYQVAATRATLSATVDVMGAAGWAAAIVALKIAGGLTMWI